MYMLNNENLIILLNKICSLFINPHKYFIYIFPNIISIGYYDLLKYCVFYMVIYIFGELLFAMQYILPLYYKISRLDYHKY